MGKKTLSVFGVILIVAGLALVAHYGYGVVYAHVQQQRLMREAQASPAESYENPVLTMEDRPQSLPRREAEDPEESLPEDEGPFVISIPRIDVEAAVLHGVDLDTLARGPGFYPDNPMPGREGNVAVAGHRTTYGAWFRRVDQLEEGDKILFTSPVAVYTYIVEDVFVVASNAWEVVDPTEEPKLTLTTCHPPGSARERMVVRAGLDGVDPR